MGGILRFGSQLSVLLIGLGVQACSADLSLHQAIDENKYNTVNRMLGSGQDANAQDDLGRTPLHVSAEQIHDAYTKLLLAKGASPNARDREGRTPLHIAAGQSAANLKTLLAAGADADIKDSTGRIPLCYALAARKQELVDPLLAKVKDWNVLCGPGITLLHLAALLESLDTFDYLVSQGASVSAIDEKGLTPALYRVARGKEDILAGRKIEIASDIERFLTKDPPKISKSSEFPQGSAVLNRIIADQFFHSHQYSAATKYYKQSIMDYNLLASQISEEKQTQ